MLRPITGHHQVSSLKLCCKSVTQLLQTRIGVEISSPTCLIRFRLLYWREVLILSGCGISAQVVGSAGGVVPDSICGGSIMGFF